MSSASLAPAAFDEAKARAFAGKLIGALGSASLVLMNAIGHRTGLFEALKRTSPCTSRELAADANLAERYVREWLAVMTTSGVVDYDPATKTYDFPAEHAAYLTPGVPVNFGITSQFLTVASSVEDDVIARFRDGKGLHYHDFERFHEVMAEASGQNVVANFIDRVMPIVPGLRERIEQGIDVIDVGCGAGRLVLLLAQAFPKSRFTGLDLCADAFAATAETARTLGLANLAFREADVADLDTLGAFDLVLATDAVHDQKDPPATLKMIRNSLRPDGAFLMVEIGGTSRLEEDVKNPLAPFLYMISCMHCTAISLGQGGPALGAMWGAELAESMLREAGFGDVTVTRLPHDIVNAYFLARP